MVIRRIKNSSDSAVQELEVVLVMGMPIHWQQDNQLSPEKIPDVPESPGGSYKATGYTILARLAL